VSDFREKATLIRAWLKGNRLNQSLAQDYGSINGKPWQIDFDNECFFIAPIGDDDSEIRKRSDAIPEPEGRRHLARWVPL
jgi:hypothetical protein